MAGTHVIDAVQLGFNSDASKNFVLETLNDGTMRLARGNKGATTQNLLTIDATGNVQLTKTTAQSMVRLNTANGYGSTNTKIRRFTNIVTNQGSDITYADSATLGASFTINTAGVYAISYTDNFTAASDAGLSLNSSQLTTNIPVINASDILSVDTTGSGSFSATASWVGYLQVNDIVRAHTNGVAVGGNVNAVQFTITRVA